MKYRKFTYLLIFLMSFPFLHAQENNEEDKPVVNIGGALRFNYNLSSWKKEQVKRGGDFGFDVFRINATAAYKGVTLNAEFRQYSRGFGGAMLKQGWVGYEFNPQNQIQIGLTQVPFGIQQYNSHNWFFNLPYYVGLEDDHDMGIKYMNDQDNWSFRLAFFKNAEELSFGDLSEVSDSRYSYDVSGRNKEVNQVNGKIEYNFGNTASNNIGLSLMYGGLYNLDTESMGDHYAIALHHELNLGNLNVKTQALTYAKNPENSEEMSDEVIAMTAYGAPYSVAAKADIYTLGIGYSVPVELGPISNLTFYNDFAYMNKHNDNFEDTYMNVTGVSIVAGQIYTYIDYAAGKHQPWLGPQWTGALAAGDPDNDWEARFNINIGYYF